MNKIFLKSVSFVLYGLLFFISFMFVPAAAAEASYAITAEAPENGEIEETITVNIEISALNTYGGNFTMTYDSSLLSIEAAEKGSLAEEEGLTFSVNKSYGENSIRVSWAKGSEIESSGCICVCTFKCLAEGTASFGFSGAGIYDGDGGEVGCVLTGGSTEINGEEAESKEPVLISLSAPESCKTTSSPEVTVVMAQDSFAYGGNAVIEYDSSLFEISGFSLGEGFSDNAVVSVNTDYSENSVKLSWADSREYTEAEELVVLTFNAKGREGTGEFNILSAFLSDGEGNSLPYTAEGAEISVSDEYILGDTDGNGEVNLLDAIALLRYIENSENGIGSLEGADVNGDGIYSEADALYIIKYAAGIITDFDSE